MNSRERVHTALSFKRPDRIPLDFGGHRSSGISAIAYARLKKALGITTGDIYVYDMVQQLAIIEQPVLDKLGVDTIEMGRAFCKEAKDWKDWTLPDGTACKIPAYVKVVKKDDTWVLLSDEGKELGIQKPGCLYFEQTYYPMETVDYYTDPFSDLKKHFSNSMWMAVGHPASHLKLEGADLKTLADGAKNLRASTDRAIIGLFGGNLFEIPQFLFKTDNYLLYMAMFPDATHRFTEKLCEMHCDNIRKWLGAVGPHIDIMMFGDDLGSNNGPMIDPAMYREYYKPWHTKMWSLVKQIAPHVKIQLHSCGGIEPFLNDLIEAGLDAVNPVQISCKGMELPNLRKKYKNRITLWGGGCDTQHILPNGTPDEVKKHVKTQIEEMKEADGGFVFQQVHNVMANIPTENLLAMFETFDKYR